MKDDAELLREYADGKSEPAFAELVQRHVNLVYAAALRRVGGDKHLAEDVTQQVFSALARDAGVLSRHPVLSGWLYTTTRNAAAQVVRTERRRQAREQEAHTMNEITSAPSRDADWERLRPVLDGAMDELNETDRQAVLLRFFEGKSFAAVGVKLQLTENSARMRVERALDKLHALLARRGVTSTTAALGLALANQAGVAAPVGLAASVTTSALAGATLGASVSMAFLKIMSSTKIAIGAVGICACLAVSALFEIKALKSATSALTTVSLERDGLRAKLNDVEGRLAAESKRAADAEKDSDELIKLMQARLAEEAARREGVPYDRSPTVTEYEKMLGAAELLASRAEFALAVRVYNQAMAVKPADLAVSENVRQMRDFLRTQNEMVEVTFTSDGVTTVEVKPFKQLGKFTTSTVKLLPGNYQVVGKREGFQDVVLPLQLRNGTLLPNRSPPSTTPRQRRPHG